MKKTAAAIFDLDGVIVDTAKYHYLAWKRLAAELGFDFSEADNERLKGVSRMRSLEILLEIGGVTATEQEKTVMAAKKNDWYLQYIQKITPAELLPGVVPFLEDLRARGIKVALASASKNARVILSRLEIEPYFDAIVDGNRVAKAKPDPEIFLTAAADLGVVPAHCVVFEDAAAGVEAGKKAGMFVVGIGDRRNLPEADLVLPGFPGFDYEALQAAIGADPEWGGDFLLTEVGYHPDRVELNGSRFLLSNGYMGYRGTLEEAGKEDLVACTLAGVYDQAGTAWREPVNAPNGLYTLLTCHGQPLQPRVIPPAAHRQVLDLRRALHRRRTTFTFGEHAVQVEAERFLSLADPHLLVMAYRFRSAQAGEIVVETGIDADVWELNGPHFAELSFTADGPVRTATARTNEGKVIAVAETVTGIEGQVELVTGKGRLLQRITLTVEAGKEYSFYKYVAVYTSLDPECVAAGGAPDLLAQEGARRAMAVGFAELRARHVACWAERWRRSRVVVTGDPEAQFALDYSIYHLLAAAPAHTEYTSIPARGLSAQTYKGAIFWDTELFMLPFFLYTQPELARKLLRYRYHTLDGARRKAAEYGYRGAFYAWESQETGDDACTYFNVTDVFSGRPLRTYFRDKQIHISADIAYAIWQYYLVTGDESLLFEGGAEIILETARFYYSYAYFKKDKNRYELLDVTGPDEYHERVNNNAYTNYMAKYNLATALATIKLLREKDEAYYRRLIEKLDYEKDLPGLAEMHELLYLPSPDPETKLLEQFDGYFRLEDVQLPDLKARMKMPNEYLGGGNGLATTTQIIKQADVVALLNLFKADFPAAVKEANWTYYEPRTEHGSSLSPCVYAMLAADLGKKDWAYRYFLRTATIDLNGDYKRYVGTLYIGGTHPAANGGAWMGAVFGFGGLRFDGTTVELKPLLPAKWQALTFKFQVKGQWFTVEMTKDRVRVRADRDNTRPVRFAVAGQEGICGEDEELVFTVPGEESLS
ncbi:beta-phosphoglucomutase [Capillibacterium thermochitinicola]|uniref:Beta-phosphoglucomutase n=1 Tax=Capillibacterium thermochitinicola TaxID=2699427 RepID=A0A8J6HQW0_9FIRM|nr:beta-phosphoglucomutase [Capillibacterium thermochitinicola]MBA2132396.1 beta-phosphoglucomutase [Capillibacterium thermochitinicola]